MEIKLCDSINKRHLFFLCKFLKCDFKGDSDSASIKSSRAFQSQGALTLKAWSPLVLSRDFRNSQQSPD